MHEAHHLLLLGLPYEKLLCFFYIYHKFYAMVKTQHNVVIKYSHCDLDGEYISN